MSKRNSAGDVLLNKVNVGLAKHQRLFASMLGPKEISENANEKLQREQEREDLEDESYGPEQFGLDAPIPKNIKNGSFTQRALTSNDKLLQTLIGKKSAKAHIASKQKPRYNATPIRFDQPAKPVRTPKPVESDDEDEGRSAAFKSKRQRTRKPAPAILEPDVLEDLEHAPESDLTLRIVSTGDNREKPSLEIGSTEVPTKNLENDGSGLENANPVKSRKQNSTPGSYLDEILAERAKKKKNKKKRDRERPSS